MRTRICKNCAQCYQLYGRMPLFFYKTNTSYCIKGKRPVAVDGCCELWKQKEQICEISVARLERAERDVIFLKENFVR